MSDDFDISETVELVDGGTQKQKMHKKAFPKRNSYRVYGLALIALVLLGIVMSISGDGYTSLVLEEAEDFERNFTDYESTVENTTELERDSSDADSDNSVKPATTPGPSRAPTPGPGGKKTDEPTSSLTASAVADATTKMEQKSTKPDDSAAKSTALVPHQDIASQQIESFQRGTGLLLNTHITHHGGTTACSVFGHILKTPSFACTNPKEGDGANVDFAHYPGPHDRPWGYNDTDGRIKQTHKYFQYVSWEFKSRDGRPLKDTNWEHKDLVSMIIMREPISRALAGNNAMKRKYAWFENKDNQNVSKEEWWQFADEEHHNNNFALSILSTSPCCDGADTNPDTLEEAKDLLRRFTFVLDIACLDVGMAKVAETLGIELEPEKANKPHHHKPLSERIPYPEVLSYLEEKNKLDIELYEWSKTLAVVDCDALRGKQAAASVDSKSTEHNTRLELPESNPKPEATKANPPKTDGSSGAKVESKSTALVLHKEIAAQQIESFQKGTGLLLNFHITHHGGTTVCHEFGYSLKIPSFACIHPTEGDGANVDFAHYPGLNDRPWEYNETDTNIKLIRPYFQMISWEFKSRVGRAHMSDTNWEHHDLVSMIVMREPISRALAGDGAMKRKYPWFETKDNQNVSKEEWWQFARDEEHHNNNFALRILSNSPCCDGVDTDPNTLEEAKNLIRRFTFIIDIACLDKGMAKVGETLGFELRPQDKPSKPHHHKPLSERIPYPEVLSYLEEKNKLDIELYEWSKTLSIVNCDALREEQDGRKQI